VRVLYVNHTSQIGGAEHSLLDLLTSLPESIQATVACPPGSLQRAIAELKLPVASVTGTSGSLRLHPVQTPRGIAQIAASAWQLHRAAAAHGTEVVHANSIRAGLIVGVARLSGAARVVHVRDRLPPGPLTTATMRLLAASADVVVANSQYTAEGVHAAVGQAQLRVIYNGIDTEVWDPARVDRERARATLPEARGSDLLLGVVAQLSPWKGQDTAIEALRQLRADGINAHLLLIGSAKFVDRATRFDNEAYVASLHELARRAGLEGHVSWLGEREDVRELMSTLDVLLLPSWEEPFGRALIEAMALRVPVIATDVGGPAEIICDGCEGLLVAPRKPELWAGAIRTLAERPEHARAMGYAGRDRVEQRFTAAQHAAEMVDVYAQAVSRMAQSAGESD
jgi:L-malate glycosyltransferase